MIRIVTHTKYAAVALAVLATCLAAPTVQANAHCAPYTAVFRLTGPSPCGPMSGSGTYNIGDLPAQSAQIAAVVKGSAVFDPTAPVSAIDFSDMVTFAPGPNGSPNILTAVDRLLRRQPGPGPSRGGLNRASQAASASMRALGEEPIRQARRPLICRPAKRYRTSM